MKMDKRRVFIQKAALVVIKYFTSLPLAGEKGATGQVLFWE
jgi:hypothetical protein